MGRDHEEVHSVLVNLGTNRAGLSADPKICGDYHEADEQHDSETESPIASTAILRRLVLREIAIQECYPVFPNVQFVEVVRMTE